MMGSATASIVTLLALYFAVLIFAVQHVSDRYSPALNTPLLIRHASIPLAILFILAVLTILLSVGGQLAKVVVMVALLTSLGGSYYLWSRLGDGEQIASLLHTLPTRRRESAVQEVLWNAAQRANPRVAAVALGVFPVGTSEQDRILRWLTEYREVLATEWMTRELINVLLPSGVTDRHGEEPSRTLRVLFADSLDREDYERALMILDGVMEALARAQPWTSAEAELLYGFGFALWNVGQPGESMARGTSIPPRLRNLQSLFHPRLRQVWSHLRALGDPEAAELYAQVLGALAAHTGDGFMLTRLYEVMEEGFQDGLWKEQALHQLAVDLRSTRQEWLSESKDRELEWIYSLAMTGAVMLVELYGREELGRYLGNAMLFEESLSHLDEKDWLSPESYAAVKQALAQRRR